MKTVTIFDIPDNKYDQVMEFLKSLQLKAVENNIHQWHVDLVNERIEEYKKNPYPMQDANDALDDIEKELDA